MDITKSQKRMLIALGIVLVYFVYDLISNMDMYKKVYLGSEDTSVTIAGADSGDTQSVAQAASQAPSYLQNWGQDPFYIFQKNQTEYIRKGKKIVKKKTLQLFAISYRNNQSVALINDKIVKVGDIISGYQVVKIDKKTVYLSDGKKKIKLILKPY